MVPVLHPVAPTITNAILANIFGKYWNLSVQESVNVYIARRLTAMKSPRTSNLFPKRAGKHYAERREMVKRSKRRSEYFHKTLKMLATIANKPAVIAAWKDQYKHKQFQKQHRIKRLKTRGILKSPKTECSVWWCDPLQKRKPRLLTGDRCVGELRHNPSDISDQEVSHARSPRFYCAPDTCSCEKNTARDFNSGNFSSFDTNKRSFEDTFIELFPFHDIQQQRRKKCFASQYAKPKSSWNGSGQKM